MHRVIGYLSIPIGVHTALLAWLPYTVSAIEVWPRNKLFPAPSGIELGGG